MGLFDGYNLSRRASGGFTPPTRSAYFSGPAIGVAPTSNAPATSSRQRGIPERFDLNTMVRPLLQPNPDSGPAIQAIQHLGRAPAGILSAPVTALNRGVAVAVGKPDSNPLLDFLGSIPLPLPSLDEKDDANGEWSLGPLHFQNIRGAVNQIGRGADQTAQVFRGDLQALNAQTIKSAMAGNPNDPVQYALPLPTLTGAIGGGETNAQFLARMQRQGFTPQDMAELQSGRDIFSFGGWDHRLSEDQLTEIGLSIALDPTTYIPLGATARLGARAGSALSRGAAPITRTIGAAAVASRDVYAGSQLALRARAGLGLLQGARAAGRAAVLAPAHIGARMLASGASEAAANLSRFSAGQYLVEAARNSTPFAIGFGRGLEVGTRPLRAMVGHAVDVKGYFTNGMAGYASRSAALRGTEALAGATGEALDTFFGDGDEVTGGWTEAVRDLGYGMLDDNPLADNVTALLISGYAFPFRDVVREGATNLSETRKSVIYRDMQPGEYLGRFEGDMSALFAPEVPAGPARVQAMYRKFGRPENAQRMLNDALTVLAREHYLRGTVNDWRVRNMPQAAGRAAESAAVTHRAIARLLERGKITGRDVVAVIRSMDAGTGGFDRARQTKRTRGALAGGEMNFDPDLAIRNYIRAQAAMAPVMEAAQQMGLQIAPGVRDVLAKETVVEARALLQTLAEGKGNARTVSVLDIQRMLRDHPQILQYDTKGYFKNLANLSEGTVKWRTVKSRLDAIERAAPSWDEITADFTTDEAKASGMGETARESGALALEDNRIRVARARPGEARVGVSRMRPELGAAPNTLAETRALRSLEPIRRFERSLGVMMYEAGLKVRQVHQTIGGWVGDDGKVAREPSVAITMEDNATLRELRETAALTGMVADQDAAIMYVTGDHLGRLKLEPNGAVGHFRGIPGRGLKRVDEVMYRRYGQDGYTIDDTAGEATIYVYGADPVALQADMAEVAREARLKQFDAEPAYGEFIERENYQSILKGSKNGPKHRKFLDGMDEALNNPDFDESTVVSRLLGSRRRTYLTPAERGDGGAGSIRHGTLTTEGLLRDTLIRLEDTNGKPIAGLEADHARVADQLENLMAARRDMLTRRSIVDQYDNSPDPFAPLGKDQMIGEVVPYKATVPKRIFEDGELVRIEDEPPAYPVGTVREAPNGGHMILREVPVSEITWGQSNADIRRVNEIAAGQKVITTEYPSVALFRGHLLGIDGHHRIAAAIKRGEATVKVWVGEMIDEGAEADSPSIPTPIDLDPATGQWTNDWTRADQEMAFVGNMAPLYEIAEELKWKTVDEWTGGERTVRAPDDLDASSIETYGFTSAPRSLSPRDTPRLNRAFEAVPATTEPRTLYRSINPERAVALREQVGRRVRWPGFMSTAETADLAKPYQVEGAPIVRVEVPAGVRLLNMDEALDTWPGVMPKMKEARANGFTTGEHVLERDLEFTVGLDGDEIVLTAHAPGQRPVTRPNAWTGAEEPVPGRPVNQVERQTRFDAAEEQVLFNRQRDAEVADLFPELRWDRSTGILSDEQKTSLSTVQKFLADQFGGAYDIVTAPELAFPNDSIVPATLKTHTLIGKWLHEYGPMSKVTAFSDWLFAPVKTAPQAKLARQALYRMLIPAGASVDDVDKWLGGLHDAARTFKLPGKHEVRVFRDATALLPNFINEAAVRAFPAKVVEQIGEGNFHLILDRAANRFVRDTLFPGLTGGGRRGRLQRTLAAGYQIWQTGSVEGNLGDLPKAQMGKRLPGVRPMAEAKRIVAKTAYPIVRFLADPRWWLQNHWEYNILSTIRDGEPTAVRGRVGRQGSGGDDVVKAGFATPPKLEEMDPIARRAAQVSIDDALLDIESVGGGMMHSRAVAGHINNLVAKRGGQVTEELVTEFIDTLDQADGWLRDLERLFPDDDTRPRSEKLNDMLYNYDERGVSTTILEEAERQFGADMVRQMEPLLMEMVDRHQGVFNDVVNMLQGNANRSNIERIANSWWLFWPLSYQLKAAKWLFESALISYGGRKTNMGGAAWWNHVITNHQKRTMEDPEYAQFFEDHEGMFAFAQMFMPLTPADVGVSLNRGIRGIGGALGWWGEYKRAQDPVSWATWVAEMGPMFTIQLARQLWAESFEKRHSGDSVGTSGGGERPIIQQPGTPGVQTGPVIQSPPN